MDQIPYSEGLRHCYCDETGRVGCAGELCACFCPAHQCAHPVCPAATYAATLLFPVRLCERERTAIDVAPLPVRRLRRKCARWTRRRIPRTLQRPSDPACSARGSASGFGIHPQLGRPQRVKVPVVARGQVKKSSSPPNTTTTTTKRRMRMRIQIASL